MALTLIEQSLKFRRRKPIAFSAIIVVFLDHVRLSVIETPRYLLVSDVCSVLLWIAYDASRASLFFLWHYSRGCALSWIKVHLPILLSLLQ